MGYNPDTGVVSFHARLSYEHIWKKSASIQGGTEKYRGNFLIDPETKEGKKALKDINAALDDIIADTWKGKVPKFKPDRHPLQEGDDMVDRDGNVRDGYEGMVYLKAANDRRPKVRDRDGETELTEEDNKIYSGAYVLVYVHFYAVTDQKKGGNGIFATLDGVQYVKKGEPFGGGGLSDDEFEKLPDDDDEEDPKPKRRRARDDDDEEEDARPARRRARDDDDEEDEPKKPARRRARDDDDEEDEPKKPVRRRARDDDDEEDEPKKPARRRSRDDDDV